MSLDRNRSLTALLVLIVTAVSAPSTAPAGAPVSPAAATASLDLDIPFQKFVLDNGLTLIVHEDHKAPIAAVNVWYHVGSKNEKAGRTGFAHLFEHLMFNGSEHHDDDYFQVMERIGATDLNGTTSEDRTNYFQNVPASALDLALWMESDRMGHLLGVVTQARLDEQRGVVQNEKRQWENQPYALSEELATKAVWPASHPYSWTVIGSMEDLNAARLEDVHEWFKTYYGAANAVVVVAGDVEAKTALEKVKKHFGDIPSGPPVSHHSAWIAKRSGVQRQIAQDRVPQARVYKIWNAPSRGDADLDRLELLADVLGSGKSSRLYKRLVYERQIATDVSAVLDSREIASLFYVQATARPGGDLAEVERAVDDELSRLVAEGPTAAELERVRTERIAGFVRGIERIGGFGGKSDILAASQVFGGRPDAWKERFRRFREATPEEVRDAGRRWLSDGVYALEIHPFPSFKTAGAGVDRSKLPEPGPAATASFPPIRRAKLPNGLEVVLAERHSVPVVNLDLVVDAGFASDRFAVPGTAQLALAMLDEGTARRTSLQIAEELSRLGATLSADSDLDTSIVSLSALKANLDASLDLLADVVLHPSFPQADFDRLKKQQLAAIQREKASPFEMSERVFPPLVYGPDHPYGIPFTGSGYEATVGKLAREDVAAFHRTWFKPNHGTIVVVGDTTLTEVLPKLETAFREWKPGDIPKKNLKEVAFAAKPVVYLVDRPGSIQSVIIAGHLAPPRANPDEIAIEGMNHVLGGAFVSRINMNLREGKHWSYGAGSAFVQARGQRPFVVFAPVQTDKTKESMVEIARELGDIVGPRPITAEELEKARTGRVLELPGAWETGESVAQWLRDIVRFGFPDDYWRTYPDRVRQVTLEQVNAAARKVLHPDRLVWVVVGDRAKVEAGVRELSFGEIRLIDADGNPASP